MAHASCICVQSHDILYTSARAQRARECERRYDPNPPAWQYPEGSRVLKVDSDGKIKLHREHWVVSRALKGERVWLVTMEQRVLVQDDKPNPKL